MSNHFGTVGAVSLWGLLVGCGAGPISPVQSGESSDAATSTSADSSTGDSITTTGAGTDTDSSTSAASESESESDSGCEPGEPYCECLPDDTCNEAEYDLHCNWGYCDYCFWAELDVLSPPCVEPDCPSDCVIDFEVHAYGALHPLMIPYMQVSYEGNLVPSQWTQADCELSSEGWTWAEEGQSIGLCGTLCEDWMNPSADGTTVTLEFACPIAE